MHIFYVLHISHLASLLNSNVTKKYLQEFEDFSKTVLLFSTFAITFSQYSFALALIYHVLPKKWKKICNCILFYNIRDLKETQDMELCTVHVQNPYQLHKTCGNEDQPHETPGGAITGATPRGAITGTTSGGATPGGAITGAITGGATPGGAAITGAITGGATPGGAITGATPGGAITGATPGGAITGTTSGGATPGGAAITGAITGGATPGGAITGTTSGGATPGGAITGAITGGATPGGAAITGAITGGATPGGAITGATPGGAITGATPGGAITGTTSGGATPGGAAITGAITGGAITGTTSGGATPGGAAITGAITGGATPGGAITGATPGGATPQETRADYTMCERNCHFILAIIVSLILLVILVIVFFCGQYQHGYILPSHSIGQPDLSFEEFEASAEALYVLSLFFTLGNCFYFSNLMYSIQNGCEDQEKLLGKISANPPQGGPNTIDYLAKKDEDFVNDAVDKLGLFQLWFLIHWIFYIISSFLSLALLLEAIVFHVKAVLPHVEDGIRFAPIEMGLIFMFSVVHLFLLIYPCLRAASVTRTRERLIRKISNRYYDHTPEDVKKKYVDFMKRQNFGFRLRILCASIPFNLNVAYISFVAGLVGIVVSLIFTV